MLIAAAACEMHPAAVLRGAELRSVREQLADADARRGRSSESATCPPIVVGERVFDGRARARGGRRAHARDSSAARAR